MSRCMYHPGKPSVLIIYGKDFCQSCRNGLLKARKTVSKHVEPKDCFLWYKGSNNWVPIPGTGCAHYVAHILGIKSNILNDKCLDGYLFRVSSLIRLTKPITFDQVQIDDIYVNPDATHTGIVVNIIPDKGKPPGPPKIIIRHSSSAQNKVADNEYATYFKGKGSFRRYG